MDHFHSDLESQIISLQRVAFYAEAKALSLEYKFKGMEKRIDELEKRLEREMMERVQFEHKIRLKMT